VLAQGGGRPGPGGPKPNRINFLATVLSLTDDQKQQATAIFDAAEQASTSLRDSLRQQRQALNGAAKASAADSQIDQLATILGDLTGGNSPPSRRRRSPSSTHFSLQTSGRSWTSCRRTAGA
jgi:LTXXQ motif family protein